MSHDGGSAYTPVADFHFPVQRPEYTGPIDVNQIADEVVARIHDDPIFAAKVAAQLGVAEQI